MLLAGSEPSVVYLILATPDPASAEARVSETGEVVYQPVHGAPLQATVVVGALESPATVNECAGESSPAPFLSVTGFDPVGMAAVEVNA
jgi:hypothetical protein